MTEEFPPLIYVDLIKVTPMSYDNYSNTKGRGFADPQTRYRAYMDSFQPWRWVAKSGDNQKAMARSSERYFNKTDALHAIHLLFGSGSNVFLRQAEFGNENLRRPSAEVPF